MEVDDSIFGTDYSSKGGVTATGDVELVTGLANARQNIYNELQTEKGFYPSIDSEYGSEIYEVLGDDYASYTVETLEVYILNCLLANPRVRSIRRIEPFVDDDGNLNFIIEIMLVNGTEDSFTIQIEED